MSVSADTNLFLYAANPSSAWHGQARRFFGDIADGGVRFVLCEFVLVEIYMQLRNPAVCTPPRSAAEAVAFCDRLRANPNWDHADWTPEIRAVLWKWAAETDSGFRRIIDARIALTLRHYGVTHFATANVADFQGFGFEKVWNPCLEPLGNAFGESVIGS
jgi:predicted nucleic acid-binding protein